MQIRIQERKATTENYGAKVVLYESSNGKRYSRASFFKLNRYGFLTTWNRFSQRRPTPMSLHEGFDPYCEDIWNELRAMEDTGDHTANVLKRFKKMDTIADEVVERKKFTNRRAEKVTDCGEYWRVRLYLADNGRLILDIDFGDETGGDAFDFSEKGEALHEFNKIKRKYDLTE